MCRYELTLSRTIVAQPHFIEKCHLNLIARQANLLESSYLASRAYEQATHPDTCTPRNRCHRRDINGPAARGRHIRGPVNATFTWGSLEHQRVSDNLQAEKIIALEAELADLRSRVDQIESGRAVIEELASINVEEPAVLDFAANATTQAPIMDGLIKAGVDSWTAEDIARKQSEASLRRLELRDDAIRDDYMGTARYREEFRKLAAAEVSIRDEVGEDYYDRFLYHTGQANRVAVESVMMGSAAENVGLQSGDVLVRYQDQKLYNWNDLRTATTQGDRNELVDITVLRSGTELTLSIPRGPLGVRLNPVRIDPDESDSS